MTASVSPVSGIDAHLTHVWRVDALVLDVKAKPNRDLSPAAEGAEAVQDELKQEYQAKLEPGVLQIHVDPDAGCFVNMMLDPNSNEVIWQYPSDSQLAYARAVNAYLRAQK